MRLLHTSDWHLGRSFHGASLLSEQEHALERVIEVARAAEVQAVLVAGDLYDRAIPSADAVDLLAHALGELRATGAQVIAITGNHDSPNRVGAFDTLLRAGGVTLRGRFDVACPLVLPASDGGPDVVVHPIPYLEPLTDPLADLPLDVDAVATAPTLESVVSADGTLPFPLAAPAGASSPAPPTAGGRRRPTHHQVLARAMTAVRADVAARGPARSVVVAHAFVAGAMPSDSERELAVGGVDRVPTSVFDGVTYTALGHLHRAQEVGQRAAYSGSLLPYSFAETAPPSMRLVTLTADGALDAETVPLGVERGVATIEGRLDALLADPAHAAVEGRWLRVRLVDEALPRHAMSRVRDRFPHAVVLEHVHATVVSAPADRRTGDERVTPFDLASEFLAERLGRAVSEPEGSLLRDAFDEVEARRREIDVTTVESGPSPVRAEDDLGSGAVA